MVEIARCRRPLADLERLLRTEDNRAASAPAPPHGLFLVQVRFPPSCYADE
jgi:tRNA U38,U39,U40 pseudouridine synthase TruA